MEGNISGVHNGINYALAFIYWGFTIVAIFILIAVVRGIMVRSKIVE